MHVPQLHLHIYTCRLTATFTITHHTTTHTPLHSMCQFTIGHDKHTTQHDTTTQHTHDTHTLTWTSSTTQERSERHICSTEKLAFLTFGCVFYCVFPKKLFHINDQISTHFTESPTRLKLETLDIETHACVTP